jgi:BolA-like protein 3
MFEVHISAKEFKNLSTVKQHQMVNAALKNEVKQMHGIRIFTESV